MTAKQRYQRALRQFAKMDAYDKRIIVGLIGHLAKAAPVKPRRAPKAGVR